MFRKLALTVAATFAVSAAALGTSAMPAAADGSNYHRHQHHDRHAHRGHHNHHRHHHHHWRGQGPAWSSYAYGGCYVQRLVATPWGPQLQWVNRCY